ncbi:MAG: UDP-glucose 4-epimerase GalE [Jatrophihabitans sp.]
MRYLVTGGAGYVGSVVAAALLQAGHQVVVLDDLSTGHADAVPDGAQFVEASITEAAEALRGVDGVLHFAAKSLVGESMTLPQLYWQNNVAGTLALLEAMRTEGVRRIVFSSTAATYGEPTAVPITEDAPARPTNTYGATKLSVDMMLTSYAKTYDFAAVSLRYFNVAGAAFDRGERHAIETHLIPIALQVVTGERPELQLYGTDYPTPDGTCVRDYIHVADLAEAHLSALTAATPGSHAIYNLGSGTGYSNRQVIDAVRSVTGHRVPVAEQPRRSGDPATLIASNAAAREHLGWSPTRDLDTMVADAFAFTSR